MVHPLTIHSYPYRKVRDPETGQNESLRIVCIRCEQARKAGTRYLKRLLPEFVIPRCVIRLDAVMKDLEKPGTLDQACATLGCIDARTVRRHREQTIPAIARVCLSLAEQITKVPQLASLSLVLPGTPLLSVLDGLIKTLGEACIKAGGGHRPLCRLALVQADLGKGAGKKSTGCVSRSCLRSAITAEQQGGP